MWIWITAILLLCLVWGGSWALSLLDVDIPLGYRVLATVFIVLWVAGVIAYRFLRARARAKALEREILKQSERQAAQVRPEKRAEIIELQRQIAQGIKALQQTKVGAKHGRSALYVLPWYAIIGPPGCGKTTALRHSGLNFPVSDPRGAGAVKGVGGTRNCDWWFSNEAILLDTAGRYATEEDDREEWLGFLDLLKKYRPRKPLNGLLVAIAASDVIQANDEQIAAYGTKLRARIDEIMTRLEMVLPVYFVVTKTDLLAGFSEFFGGLRKSERDQIFGASFALNNDPNADPGAMFAAEFDRLTSILHARAVRVISEERQPLTRQRIFQFPLEFKGLRTNLEDLLRIVFAPNTYQESPLFRGFYFTSGTQEGRPIDRVIGSMARAFGLRVSDQAGEPREPRSYFVTDLFRKVVFPDQDLAGSTEAAMRRRFWTGVAIATGLSAIGLALLGPGGCTFGNNRELISDVRESSLNAAAVKWPGNAPATTDVPHVDRLRDRVTTLYDWEENGAPARYRWGMYSGDVLYTPTRDAFVRMHEVHISEPVHQSVWSNLGELGKVSQVSPENFGKYYDHLKLYLMMSIPERLDVDWATMRLSQHWLGLSDSAAIVEKPMAANLKHYVTLIKRKEAAPWKADEALIARSRDKLLQIPRLKLLYEILVRDANTEIAPIKRSDIFDGSVARFVTSRAEKVVQGAYTKYGWAKVKNLLNAQQSRLADEGWVLGQERELARGDLNKQIDELRVLYFQNYKSAWEDFLTDMEVHQPENAEVALEELQALSEPPWPYQRLINTIEEHTTLILEDEPDSLAEGILEKIKEKAEKKAVAEAAKKGLMDAGAPNQPKQRARSDVEKAFSPMVEFGVPPKGKPDAASATRLAQYQQLLADLVAVLTDLRDGDKSPDTTKAATSFEQAFRQATSLLTSQTGYTRPILSPYIMRPITAAWAGVVTDAGKAAGGAWETEVWTKWHQKCEGRYPFADSPKDCKIEDYTAFFQPENGLLWKFYKANLEGSIRRNGDSFMPTKRFQTATSFLSDFLSNCLERGSKITTATFPDKGEVPSIKFDINLHSVSPDVAEVQLDIDGTTKSYKNTPERWLSTEWPAKEPKARGAKVRIRGYSGLDEQIIREGDFGLFRLLDAAEKLEPVKPTPDSTGTSAVIATWKLRSQGQYFKLDIRSSRADGVPSSSLFRDYNCPRVIVAAGR
ncbi:MAG: type VI secretion system membrane subunit TssM [Myxococcales bacterium]